MVYVQERVVSYGMQAQHWQSYAQMEIRMRQYTQAKGIFSRCLLNCFSVPLWTTYIDFIKQVLFSASLLHLTLQSAS